MYFNRRAFLHNCPYESQSGYKWLILFVYVHVLFNVSLFLSGSLYNLTDSVSSYIITNCMSLYMYVFWSVFLAFFFSECLYQSPAIGRFSEAGLHEWMPFVIFRARSRERSQRHFRPDFWVGVAWPAVYKRQEKSPSIKVHRVTDPFLFLNIRSTFVRLLVKWSL